MWHPETAGVERAASSVWTRIRALVALSRPLDSVTVGLAVVLGLVVAADGEPFPLWKAIAGFVTGYLLLAGTDTINDVADLDTDSISKPWRPLPTGRVEPRVATFTGGFEMAVALGVAATLSMGTLMISGAAAAVGIAYSWRLKNLFIVKNVVAAGTLMLPVAAGAMIITLDWPPLLWSLFPLVFLSALAFEIHKDVLDLEADHVRGRRTIPNTLSVPYPQWIIGGAYAGAYGIAWWLIRIEPLGALYGWALAATGPLLVFGVALLRPPVVRRRNRVAVYLRPSTPPAAPSSSTQSRLRLRRRAVPGDADDSEIPNRYFSDTPPGGRSVARLQASFQATNVAFLIAMVAIGVEALTA